MRRTFWPALATVVTLAACADAPSAPEAPRAPPAPPPLLGAGGGGGGPTGALFTTTPDGGIVNENVHYPSKLWVYLDGGPGPNAPQTAAGLDDGKYVFQVTDPSGKYLLSMDPAKCRVVEVADGVIVRLVPATELGFPSNDYTTGNGGNQVVHPCHVQDAPTPPTPAGPDDFGPSGRHDTNVDTDHGDAGAIVVQLMPFGTTPNPGGVYKAWITPLGAYADKGGDLGELPSPVKGKASQPCPDDCFAADPGFGPPRNIQKTDNFKVKEAPPRIIVIKFHDLDGDGVRDPGEPEIPGWEITLTETLFDGTEISNTVFTPVSRAVAPNSTVEVCEALPEGWIQSHLSVDGVPQAVAQCVDVVFGAGDMEHTVVFGNFMNAVKSGSKFHDLDANGVWDAGEPGLPDWTIEIAGTTGAGQALATSTTTGADGSYAFEVPPGSYTVSEVCPDGWVQSHPTPTDGCGSGVHHVTLTSGQVEEDNDFGNWTPASKSGSKFFDRDGDGQGDATIAGWTIALLDGAGTLLSTTTTGEDGSYAFTGLAPGDYIVCEEDRNGFHQTSPLGGEGIVDCSGLGDYAAWGFGFTLQSGDSHEGNDFCNTANCVGLTPGYWVNWRNHYTDAQFLQLLEGTIAGDIAEADQILESIGCDYGDALHCMRRFLLATQLTLNLTGSELPNPSGGNLTTFCQAEGDPENLAFWLGEALAIHAADGAGFDRDYILTVKGWLDTYANLVQIVFTP